MALSIIKFSNNQINLYLVKNYTNISIINSTSMDKFCGGALAEAYLKGKQKEAYNFVEVTRLPKKFDCKALTSIVSSASRIVPKTTDICIRKDAFGNEEQVALLEFKSELDAYKAMEKMRLSPIFKTWSMKRIIDPKLTNPEAEAFRKWLN